MPTPWNNTNISNKNNGIPTIAIASPYKGSWNPEWVIKTRDPLHFTQLEWCNKIPIMSRIESLPVARTSLVYEALKYNADYIFFIDIDTIFESPTNPNVALNMLYQLINKNKEEKKDKIISGLYRAKQKVGFNYAAWKRAPNGQKGYSPLQSWTGNWIEVDVTGLGCTLIDMNIFKELPEPWFYWESPNDISEDFYFFELAKKYGYNLHCFTDVKLVHLGNMKVKCDGTFSVQEM
jgi:hypothetical protein